MGNMTLNDPDADISLWCATFRKWRDIQNFPALFAAVMLHTSVPGTLSWVRTRRRSRGVHAARQRQATDVTRLGGFSRL